MLRMLLFSAVVAVIAMAAQRRDGDDVPAAGVPLSLAEERAARLKDVRYDLHFTIPAALTEAIRGKAVVRFNLNDPSRPLVFDFAGPAAGLSVTVGGTAATFASANEHIVFPPDE